MVLSAAALIWLTVTFLFMLIFMVYLWEEDKSFWPGTTTAWTLFWIDLSSHCCVMFGDLTAPTPRSSALTFGHVLRDDVYGLLRHHGVQRHQLVVSQPLHDLRLLEERFRRHGPRLQRLDGHLGGAVPRSCSRGRDHSWFSKHRGSVRDRHIWTVSGDTEETTNGGSCCRKWSDSQGED